MTRSFDRRGGYPGVNFNSATGYFSVSPTKKEEADLSLDCMCEKNDPNCAECWISRLPENAPNLRAMAKAKQFANAQHFLATTKSEFDQDVRMRFEECEELLLRKHKDYGPSNIGNAPGGALNGLRVRMHDKLARINHLIDTGVEPSNESLRDSFLDLANYSVIALMVLDGRWPTAYARIIEENDE